MSGERLPRRDLWEVLVAGFGGQGILTAGLILAQAGLMEGREVSWLPSYGPEMRGGTAHCHVVLSDETVASPLVPHPDILLLFNKPSLERFESTLRPGGFLIANSSLVPPATRTDVHRVEIPATRMAHEIGAPAVANMAMLGALVAVTGAVSFESLEAALPVVISERHADKIPLNIEAIRRGMTEGARALAAQSL